jgi:DNA-binding NarL/FixJ family response regulator
MTEGRGGITILLADEQALFREAVRVVIEEQEDLRVVAEARDGIQAVLAAERHRPNVAIIDAALPNCDGVRATTLIKQRVPRSRVLLMGSEGEDQLLIEAIEAGADGYLTKASAMSELIHATRAIHRGDTLIPPRMLGPLLERLIARRRIGDEALRRSGRLTRREREVLTLLARGSDNNAIAQHLVISPQTARTHVQNLLTKLEVHSRLEAVAFAVQNGIVGDLVGSVR